MKRWMILAIMIATAIPGQAQLDPYLAGRALMIQGKYDSALVQLDRALEKEPGKTEIYMSQGICCFSLNRIPAAREAFYEVEKRREGMASLYLARIEVRLNHPELAVKYLKEHLSSKYRIPENEILLDPDLSRLEGSEAWQQLWKEQNWYSESDKEFQEALFLKENGDALEAINRLNRLEKENYNRSSVFEAKADIYKKLGNNKAAISALNDAVKSDVRNLDALMKLSYFEIENGDLDDAVYALDRVIRQEPYRFEAYLLRATARSGTDNLRGALEDLELYLSYFPNSHEVIYQKGIIQYEHGRYLDAIQSFNKALDMDRGNAAYYFARGRTYASTGTTRYADKDLSMALDLDPYNGDIWLEKGKIARKLGDLEGACHCFRMAFQYGIYEAQELLERCK